MAVLVLAAGANALGVVRGLALGGLSTIVASRSRFDAAMLSRIPARRIVIPCDIDVAEWLVAYLEDSSMEIECIVPTSDEYVSVLAVLAKHERLPVPAVYPSPELVKRLNDKKLEVALAAQHGIPIPRTISDLNNLDVVAEHLRYPVIVKPRLYSGYEILGQKNVVLQNEYELAGFLTDFKKWLSEFILQEVIVGDVSEQWVCNATFDENHELASAFTFQRKGTIPYGFGVTTFAVSRRNDEVIEICRRIGIALQYVGPAMIEFKRDEQTGVYLYIETNPRLGLCNWFDTSCGVTNAFNAVMLALRGYVDCAGQVQQEGTVFLNWPLEILARLRVGKSAFRLVSELVALRPSKIVFPCWSIRDPLPAVSHLLVAVERRFRR